VDPLSDAAVDSCQAGGLKAEKAVPLALPRVIGHRGAAAAAPENTLAGIAKAKALGASWIEFDVKLTEDGHAVLFHDDRLERTTDGRGLVAATTLAAIRKLDAGSWFGPAFRGEPVPRFEEALALCAELGLGINAEIKPCPGRERETAAATMRSLLESWPRSMPPPLVSSFAPASLRVAQETAPEMPRGYLAGTLPRWWRQLMAQYGCATLHLNHRRIVPWQRASVVAAGVPLVLYTVNNGPAARRCLEAGVTAVFSDHVDRVLAALAPVAASTPADQRKGEPAPCRAPS
jgi:glycerophosphoryl diester phosphodiesterase